MAFELLKKNLGRRRFIQLTGASSIGLAGLSTPVLANPGQRTGDQPLEETPSFLATVAFPTVPGGNPNFFFGFPSMPPIAGFDPGMQFDTTSATITPNKKTIHYHLEFGIHKHDTKPYPLTHEGDGVYVSRGAVINFEINEGEPNPLSLDPGHYRASARDVVQLYEPGGYFDWSVTRTDVFSRPGMDYIQSFLIIVWDEDRDDNNDGDDGGIPLNDPNYRSKDGDPSADTPEFSEGVLGEDVYNAIVFQATSLKDAGVSTPGG